MLSAGSIIHRFSFQASVREPSSNVMESAFCMLSTASVKIIKTTP